MTETEETERTGHYFLITVIGLVFLGVVMVFSSSYMYAKDTFGTPLFFVIRQLVAITVGVVAASFLAKTKLSFWYKFSFFIHAFCIVLLILTFVPGLGLNIKGSQRWINLGFMSLQPGELVKYSFIFAAAKYFENFQLYGAKEKLKFGLLLASPLVFLVLQPDFGTFLICSLILFFMAFLSQFPRKYLWMLAGSGLVLVVTILIAAPYRVRRIMTFLDPWKDPKDSGFQIIQSFLAFAHGGLTGQGLGNSHEKLFYLPESYNDFIFSVVGEEMGFFGVALFSCAFLILTLLGFKLALKMKSRLSSLVIATIIFTISLQAFLNMGVVLGLLPTKGLNLPFISYGGSSMIANIAAIGLIFSALRFNEKSQAGTWKEI
jgi:cell division protein FtsW